MSVTVTEREGDGLIELEKALDQMLETANAVPVPNRGVVIVIDLDYGGARRLRNALQLARLNGAAIQ